MSQIQRQLYRPTYWRYDDVYASIIKYITTDLDQARYVLNFGVIALHTTEPKVLVRFTIRSLQTNHEQQWEIILMGVTRNHLYQAVYTTVESRKN